MGPDDSGQPLSGVFELSPSGRVLERDRRRILSTMRCFVYNSLVGANLTPPFTVVSRPRTLLQSTFSAYQSQRKERSLVAKLERHSCEHTAWAGDPRVLWRVALQTWPGSQRPPPTTQLVSAPPDKVPRLVDH